MGLDLRKAIGAILYFCAALSLPAKATEVLRPSVVAESQEPSQSSAQNTYPESIEGLKSQLKDLFAAVKADDTSRSSARLADFAIPNHEQWFLKTFGPTEGARLEAKFEELQTADRLKKMIELNVKEGRTQIAVQSVSKPEDTQMRLIHAVSAALVQPTTIHMVSLAKEVDDKSPYSLGDFVYVQGGFRYLDRQVVQALSTAPRLRIRVGGNVAAARIMNRVEPVYPPDARTARLSGTVLLDVIIGVDGTVQQVQLISGHPMLVQSALDAVRQWRYQPTLLNGQPVEVETQVNVIFSLKP